MLQQIPSETGVAIGALVSSASPAATEGLINSAAAATNGW
jgi:hypothetical protein